METRTYICESMTKPGSDMLPPAQPLEMEKSFECLHRREHIKR